jgi:hypothetical protein
MPAHVLVWDIETIPDLRGFAAANGHDGKSDDDVLSSFAPKAKATLHEICKVMVPGNQMGSLERMWTGTTGKEKSETFPSTANLMFYTRIGSG